MSDAKEPPLRFLTVDDEPGDRAMVRREIEALYPDGEVVEAGTRQAFELALEQPQFDLVITDLDLKWGDGREVLARVREILPGCPVVMFTDSGDETTAVALMKAGLDDYLVKSARQLPRLRASIKINLEAGRHRTALSEGERRLAAALDHQRIIVQELHHRVRNNLQTITSLLLYRARLRGGEVGSELEDLAGRMQALAGVQARIYSTDALDRVDFAAVLGDMTAELARIYGNGHITHLRDFEGGLDLDVARAMPLGLLCYELLLNAFKHAWPDRQAGKLTVQLRVPPDGAEIQVRDDGVGFMDDAVTQGLGTRLARSLAKEAMVEVRTITTPGHGTAVTLRLI